MPNDAGAGYLVSSQGILQTDTEEGKTPQNKLALNEDCTVWGWHGNMGALRGAIVWLVLSKEVSWQRGNREHHGKGKQANGTFPPS